MSKPTNKMVRLVVKDLLSVTEQNPDGDKYVAIVSPNKVQKYKQDLPENLLVVREFWR